MTLQSKGISVTEIRCENIIKEGSRAGNKCGKMLMKARLAKHSVVVIKCHCCKQYTKKVG